MEFVKYITKLEKYPKINSKKWTQKHMKTKIQLIIKNKIKKWGELFSASDFV
jgi:hypothetical protein